MGHVMFCIDASGSMQPHWKAVISSYKLFLDQLSGNGDRCSLVTFSDTATVAFKNVDVMSAKTAADKVSCCMYTTYYGQAFKEIHEVALDMRKDSASVADKALLPVLIFLTDGMPSDQQDAERQAQVLAETFPDMSVHLLMFGHDRSAMSVLQKLSKTFNGTIHEAATHETLQSVFSTIASQVSYL